MVGEATLATRGQFASRRLINFPPDDEAKRYFQHGPTPIRRYLPYWLVNLVERFWFLVLPIVTLLIPMLGFGPTAIDWTNRRRVYRWHRELAAIETASDLADSRTDAVGLIDRLDALRAHIAFVWQTIARYWRIDDPKLRRPMEEIVTE